MRDPRGADNVDVRGWLPHDAVLPSVDLVIGHGGHSTTMKALAHGVPLLVIPVNPISDQRQIGQMLQQTRLGLELAKSASAEEIRSAANSLLADDTLRANAAATGRRLRSTPSGAELAAAKLITLVRAAT